MVGSKLNRRTISFTAVSVFVCCLTSYAEDPAAANREALGNSLRRFALAAQRYYHTPTSDGGGGGSFATTFLSGLLLRPNNSYGSFYLAAPTSSSIILGGSGREIGFDGSSPVEVEVIVYPDSVSMTITN